MNYSTDRGSTWQASDFRVDTNTNAAHAEWPTIRVDREGNVYVGWGYHRISWGGALTDYHFNVSPAKDTEPPVLPELPVGGNLGINPDPLPACVEGLVATDNIDGEVPVACSAGEVTGDPGNKNQVFTYTATDAAGNTATGTVTYSWQEAWIRITFEEHLDEHAIQIQSVSSLGGDYAQYLESCTNLVEVPQSWICILTNSVPFAWPATNLWQFDRQTEDRWRYYRIRQWLEP